jgi:autotransporter-associated beta strand protein
MGTTGSFGTGTVAIESGAFVDFNRSNSYICANVISGAGKVRNISTGPTILTASNSYTGGTDITAGTLGFASGGLGSSGSVTLTAGTTLRWYSGNTQDISSRIVFASGANAIEVDSGNVTLATTISNSAVALQKKGSGRLILGGPSTVLYSLTVTAGTLCIGDGDMGLTFTATNGIAIASGATLEVNESTIINLVNVISGAGGVKIAGSGDVIISSGGNTYTGQTEVYSGTLRLDADITSNIVVRSGATLSAYDDTSAASVGDITFDSGSVFHLETGIYTATGGQISAGAVVATAGATGTVTVPTGNFAISTALPLLEYTSLTGAFIGMLDGATFSTGAIAPFATNWQVVYNIGGGSNQLGLVAIA